ncbi:hypothetical protein GE09DRAFT_448411 [Coniochaeta sp. 2T2.1]|nr:hypothetical protein GE09DRAFT_448411 [Coniochaeta sp. 2T2.1]
MPVSVSTETERRPAPTGRSRLPSWRIYWRLQNWRWGSYLIANIISFLVPVVGAIAQKSEGQGLLLILAGYDQHLHSPTALGRETWLTGEAYIVAGASLWGCSSGHNTTGARSSSSARCSTHYAVHVPCTTSILSEKLAPMTYTFGFPCRQCAASSWPWGWKHASSTSGSN